MVCGKKALIFGLFEIDHREKKEKIRKWIKIL
jgi:hypothetical protein